MFNLRTVLAASVGACLLGGVAVAQPTPTPPPATAATPAASPAASNHTSPVSATTSAPADVTVTTRVDPNGNRHLDIANPPVPDTVENRAKYGQPLSAAGRRTPTAPSPQPAGAQPD